MTTGDRELPEKLLAYLIGDQILLVDAFPKDVSKKPAKYLCEVPLWGTILEAYNERPMAPYWSVSTFKNLVAGVISSEIKKTQNLWDALSVLGVPMDRKNQIVEETANEDMISAYEDILTRIRQVTYTPIQRDPEMQTDMLSHQYLTEEKFDFTSVPFDLQVGCTPHVNRY